MIYALVADIHANAQALTAVLACLDHRPVDRLVCLGDLVGYCAEPNRCVDLLRERQALCIRGNHDPVAAGLAEPIDFCEWARRSTLWTRRQLTPANLDFLQKLPLTAQLDDHTFAVHASLYPQPNEHVRLKGIAEAQQAFTVMREQFPDVRICFFGHTHRAAAYHFHDDHVTKVEVQPESETLTLNLDPEGQYLINPGSVGMARDGTRLASFALYDSSAHAIQFVRIPHNWYHSYDLALKAGIVHNHGFAARLKNRVAHLIGL